ncbi:MAG: class I tRNA ligase family protein [Christensenellaceae bacterium]
MEIEAYGIEPFINECKKSVWQYDGVETCPTAWAIGAIWTTVRHLSRRLYRIGMVGAEKIHEKGLLYKGHKIVPYCPRCGTALSSHEVAQGYKDVKQTTVFVKFKVKGEENKYILAWTTTPWTLPSNVALCLNPSSNYAEIETEEGGEHYILAEALVKSVFGEEGYRLVSVKKGRNTSIPNTSRYILTERKNSLSAKRRITSPATIT